MMSNSAVRWLLCSLAAACGSTLLFAEPSAPPATMPTTAPATQPAAPEEMVSISFRDAGVDQLFTFISDKTGKPVIPQESIKQKRITVVSTQQRPLSEAMQIIAEALRQNGIVMEESPRVINMKALSDAKQSLLQVVPPEQSVSAIANKAQVVHKIFALKFFNVSKMKDVILPLLPDFGQITADGNSGRLMVTDTVEDLERIEKLIGSLDVAEAEQTVKKIIVVKQGDASDIVSTVRVLIASSLGAQAREVIAGGGGSASGGGAAPSRPSPMPSMPDGMMMPGGDGGPPSGGSSSSSRGGGAGSAVFVEENKAPVVLLADVTRNWIIAVASPRIMALIDEWVAKLDVPAAANESQFDVLSIEHADMAEVAKQISATIDALPTSDAQKSVRLVPFTQSRKILVSGSKRGRELVKNLLTDLDKESGNQVMRVFQLKYADAADIAANIEQLYGVKKDSGYNPFSYYSRSSGSDDKPVARVKVTADERRNALIIYSDAAMLDQIEKLLRDDWDLPLSEADAQPKIYTLKHLDPLKLKDLMEDLFFKGKKKSDSSEDSSFYEYLTDLGASRDEKPVGRLYGQFRFQAMPDSDRFLVIAKNASNYAIMDKLIAELDQPQDAGLPQMIELKHANAEDLAEQLNATLAESGTLAEIVREKRDFASPTRSGGVSNSQQTNNTGNVSVNAQQQQQNQNQSTNPNSMTFWWQRSQRRVDEQPTSNLIGKIRFVPIDRRNALLVVAPAAYCDPLRQLVEQLDQPGMQVMIHATIAEVQSTDSSSLGLRLASNPAVFNDSRLQDGSIGGSAAFATQSVNGGPVGSSFSSGVFNAGLNVNVLLELLIRNYGLKILFEPKLFTADNQEAEFFDGQDVPYQTQAQSSAEGTAVTQSFSYTPIGTFLRIRPHVTNERDVDLTVNLQLSSIVTGQTSFGNFIFDRRETTTHVVLRDSETVMLSGIIQQQTSKDVRKIPFLGDLPLVGAIFRSTEETKQNRELVAFITPHVIRRESEPVAAGEYKDWIEKLRNDLGRKPTTDPVAPIPAHP